MEIGFKTAPQRVEWATLEAIWARAGELDVFDSAWLYDHFYPVDGDGSCLEGWTTLAALAHHVPGKRVGHLVLANPYRNPGLLAKMATAMDHVTNGRFILGLGAGWHMQEASAFGFEMPPVGARLKDLDAALTVIRALFDERAARWPDPADGPSSEVGGISLEAGPYRLWHARNDPPPLTPGGPPIWLGTQGERVGLPMAARHADGWNYAGRLGGGTAEFVAKRDSLLRRCEALGRDPAGLTISVQLAIGPLGEDLRPLLDECLQFAAAGCQHLIIYFDSRGGPAALDRLAREVAAPLKDELG